MIGRALLLARGQVRVRVTGASLARFLNACAQNGLTLRRLRRTGWNELYATLSVADFKALPRYMGRTGCRVHIVRRRGAPFAAARLRRRYVLWGGLLAFALLCYVLLSRVWAIETHIAPNVPRAALLARLEEEGVAIGARRRAIDVNVVRWRVMRDMPEIGFLSLNIQGNRLTIEAFGVHAPPELLDEQAAVKVVARRAGVITGLRVQQGEPLLHVGDAVAAGETIISGLVPPRTETGAYHLTHARGVVRARTFYRLTAAQPLQRLQKTYTGRVKRQFALVFQDKRLNLYFGSGISGSTCDKIVSVKRLWLSESVALPVSLVVQTYRYYEAAPVTAAAEDVADALCRRAIEGLELGMDGTVTNWQAETAERNGAAVLTLTAEADEQIGSEALDDSELPTLPPAEQPVS